MEEMKSVAVVILGDEILDGSVQDTNSCFLARSVAALGSQVTRILTLPDVPAVIAPELASLASSHDYVITSGGIGSTPDDRTWEAISMAFDVPLAPHPDLVRIVERRYRGDELTWALRMASPPAGAELIPGGRFAWPLIRFRNLFVLPGVPRILEDKFPLLAPLLESMAFHVGHLKVRVREPALAGCMAALARAWPTVRIGSYPVLTPEPHVRLVVRSRDPAAASAVIEALIARFDSADVIEVQPPVFT